MRLKDFQLSVAGWMIMCFGREVADNVTERGDRLLEETLELLQATNYDPKRVSTLVDYVWGRPPGDPIQEVGGVIITLTAMADALKIDLASASVTELNRVWSKMPEIRAKQASKRDIHSPLPI